MQRHFFVVFVIRPDKGVAVLKYHQPISRACIGEARPVGRA